MADFMSIEDTRFEAAAAWYVRLDGDVHEDDWLTFTAWLEADPQNRSAFDDICDASDEIDAQKDALAGDRMESTASQHVAEIIPFATLRPTLQTHASLASPRRRTTRAWVAGAAAVAAALLVAVFVQSDLIDAPHVQSLETRIGEHQTVKLEDGSEIQLNTNTAVSVSFTRKLRSVQLARGEAHFDVTSNPSRPFMVAVGDRRVEVVGTAFDILKNEGQVTVTVARGIVKVGPNTETSKATIGNSSVRLTVGDQYSGHEGDAAYQVVKVDPATILAWRNGRLIYDDATLFQVISDLNRYFDQKLIIKDDAAGALRFTGTLKIDDETSLVKRLESLLPVTVQSRGDDIVLERRLSE